MNGYISCKFKNTYSIIYNGTEEAITLIKKFVAKLYEESDAAKSRMIIYVREVFESEDGKEPLEAGDLLVTFPSIEAEKTHRIRIGDMVVYRVSKNKLLIIRRESLEKAKKDRND
jgi:hypothetical protein